MKIQKKKIMFKFVRASICPTFIYKKIERKVYTDVGGDIKMAM